MTFEQDRIESLFASYAGYTITSDNVKDIPVHPLFGTFVVYGSQSTAKFLDLLFCYGYPADLVTTSVLAPLSEYVVRDGNRLSLSCESFDFVDQKAQLVETSVIGQDGDRLAHTSFGSSLPEAVLQAMADAGASVEAELGSACWMHLRLKLSVPEPLDTFR